MIRVQNLSKQFRGERTVEAVSDLSFQIDRGSFMAIVGRSGSGKSTLLAMMGGINSPTTGSVDIDGTSLWEVDANARADYRNRNIGFVFQFASLLPSLRAIDNVVLPALVSGFLGYREAYARARALLEQVGLKERTDFYPGQLSGGEQRRVAIARALINEPSLLVADEPTADLDEETESEILNLILDIHRALKLTLVVVTHNPAIAERADCVLEMRAGKAVIKTTEQTAQQVIASHSEPADAARVKTIFQIPSQVSSKENMKLGEGIDRFVGRLVLCAIPLIALIWGLNTVVAMCQSSLLQAQADQRQTLEDLAMKGLRADIKDVTFGPGQSYLLSIYLRNTTGDQPIYVMSPVVRAFIQVGTSWQEVPMKPARNTAEQVLKVVDEQIYKFVVEPDVSEYAQLLPYYMHIRFSNDMLISPRSQPKDDLIDRSDNYYVYLKPHDADDSAILKKMKFPGTPPVWIPMPPH